MSGDAEATAKSKSDDAPTSAAAENIRSAAKWFITAYGAIGAAVVAGVAFADVGKLEGLDLTLALLGIVVAYLGILLATLSVLDLLTPVSWTLSKLEDAADTDPAKQHLAAAPNLLIPFANVDQLYTARTQALQEYSTAFHNWRANQDATTTAAVRRAEIVTAPIEAVSATVLSWANYQTLLDRFQRAVKEGLIPGITLVLIGLVVFAVYVTDVPKPSPASLAGANLQGATLKGSDLSGVNLRKAILTDADLTNANLANATLDGAQFDRANLTGANLEGASTTGASVAEVTWGSTTCPDGKESDDVGGSCEAHLKEDTD